MAKFITLTCPTCGGMLEAKSDAKSLVCNFCGNQHLVNREDSGFITLDFASVRIPTEKELLKNVHPSYHPTYNRIIAEFVQPNEKILAAANGSRTSEYQNDYGKQKIKRASFSCLVMITNFRWIRAGMQWQGSADHIVYYRTGSIFSSWLGEGEYFQHEWVTPPKHLPEGFDPGSARFRKRIDEYVIEAPLKKMNGVQGKDSYVIEYAGKSIDICEIDFGDTWVAFYKADGERIYSLLQVAMQNNGIIPT